ncbi:MAG: serine acetyltransferase [Chloroflexi bacterium]|nr:serine acetyltransferase [Chloroflexota bacterium]
MIQSKEDYAFYLEADKVALRLPEHKSFRETMKRLVIFPDLAEEVWKFQRALRTVEYLFHQKRSVYGLVRYAAAVREFRRRQASTGFRIWPNCFGPGLSIVHLGPIEVHPEARIGANCRLHPMVTIGTALGYTNKVPHLGDNIFIGPGARIFGQIEVADNIVIGAGSVVNKSFTEPGITIAGVPARKISDRPSPILRATEILRKKMAEPARCRKEFEQAERMCRRC